MTHRVDARIFRYGKTLKWDFSAPVVNVSSSLRMRYMAISVINWFFLARGIRLIKIYYSLESTIPVIRVVGYRRHYETTMYSVAGFNWSQLDGEKRNTAFEGGKTIVVPSMFSKWGKLKFSPERVDFTVDPYSGLISRRENYDSTVRKRLYPLSTRLNRPILYRGNKFSDSYSALLRIENYALSLFGGSVKQYLSLTPQSLFRGMLDRLRLSRLPQGLGVLLKFEEAAGRLSKNLLRTINLAAAESFVANYCNTYVYRFLSAANFKAGSMRYFDVVARGSFFVNYGMAAAGRFFDDASIAQRSLFSPSFYLLACKVENAMKFYKEKKNLLRVTMVDALLIVTRKLAYLATCRAMESSIFSVSPNLAVSSCLFFMKLCSTKFARINLFFSVGECRRAFFERMRSLLIVFNRISNRTTIVRSKVRALKVRVFGIKISRAIGLLVSGAFRQVNEFLSSLELEAEALGAEFAGNKANGITARFFPPRPVGLGRVKDYYSGASSTRSRLVVREKKYPDAGKVLNKIWGFAPGLLSSMVKAEERNDLFKALKPIKRLDYYRETDDTYAAAGSIPKRRELLRRVRAAREDRKRAYELFSAAAVGDRESVPKLAEYVNRLKEQVSAFCKMDRNPQAEKLLKIVVLSFKFVRKLSKKVESGHPIRSNGRLIRIMLRRVTQLFALTTTVTKKLVDERSKSAWLAFRFKLFGNALSSEDFKHRGSLKDFLPFTFAPAELGLGFKAKILTKFLLAEYAARFTGLGHTFITFPLVLINAYSSACKFTKAVLPEWLDENFRDSGILSLEKTRRWVQLQETLSMLLTDAKQLPNPDTRYKCREDISSAAWRSARHFKSQGPRKGSMDSTVRWLVRKDFLLDLTREFSIIFGYPWVVDYFSMTDLFENNFLLAELANRANKVIIKLTGNPTTAETLTELSFILYTSLYTRSFNHLLDFIAGFMAYSMSHKMLMSAFGSFINNLNLSDFGISGLRFGLYGKFGGHDRGNRIVLLWGLNPCLRSRELVCTHADRQSFSIYGITHLHLWVSYLR